MAPPGHTLVQPERGAQGPPLEEIPGIWSFRVKPGAEVKFDDLRYGTHALESYRVFRRLRDDGVIDQGVRFQMCLPGDVQRDRLELRGAGRLAPAVPRLQRPHAGGDRAGAHGRSRPTTW